MRTPVDHQRSARTLHSHVYSRCNLDVCITFKLIIPVASRDCRHSETRPLHACYYGPRAISIIIIITRGCTAGDEKTPRRRNFPPLLLFRPVPATLIPAWFDARVKTPGRSLFVFSLSFVHCRFPVISLFSFLPGRIFRTRLNLSFQSTSSIL